MIHTDVRVNTGERFKSLIRPTQRWSRWPRAGVNIQSRGENVCLWDEVDEYRTWRHDSICYYC